MKWGLCCCGEVCGWVFGVVVAVAWLDWYFVEPTSISWARVLVSSEVLILFREGVEEMRDEAQGRGICEDRSEAMQERDKGRCRCKK